MKGGKEKKEPIRMGGVVRLGSWDLDEDRRSVRVRIASFSGREGHVEGRRGKKKKKRGGEEAKRYKQASSLHDSLLSGLRFTK